MNALRYGTAQQARADARACEGAERRPVGRPSDLAGGWGGAPRNEALLNLDETQTKE